jgi:peptide/nickel transport system permease protein
MTRALLHDRAAFVSFLVLAVIAAACVLAPLYAARVSGTDPFSTNIDGRVNGVEVLRQNTDGLGLGSTPIGPGWRASYLLGADGQGRDLAARLLFGGRTSLVIAAAATALTLVLALPIGMLAGYAGGKTDAALSLLLDLLWAFPVYLLAISLSAVLISQSDSLLVPIAILGVIYVPYVARPLRSEVRGVAETEFVAAAVSLGATSAHVLRRHVLPSAASQLLLFAPVVMAFDLLTEAALSVLSVGVQAPGASWGTLIADGQVLIYSRPLAAIAPGLAVVATVLALNVLSERVQVALDARAR